MPQTQGRLSSRPIADLEFLRIFLPPEIRLAQRQFMIQSSRSVSGEPSSCLGLYFVRLQSMQGDRFPASAEGGSQIGDHLQELMHEVVRDSDIPVRISDQEHLAVLRDLDPERTYVVSQRFLASAAESDLLQPADLGARVGYIIYPLSSQPNYPHEQWETIVELARKMSMHGEPSGRASGYGLLRGPKMRETGMPEADLIPVAIRDPESLARLGLLKIQKIHLMPSV